MSIKREKHKRRKIRSLIRVFFHPRKTKNENGTECDFPIYKNKKESSDEGSEKNQHQYVKLYMSTEKKKCKTAHLIRKSNEEKRKDKECVKDIFVLKETNKEGTAKEEDVEMEDADMSKANREQVEVEDADIGEADLDETYIEEASIEETDMEEADIDEEIQTNINPLHINKRKSIVENKVNKEEENNIEEKNVKEENLEEVYIKKENIYEKDKKEEQLKIGPLPVEMKKTNLSPINEKTILVNKIRETLMAVKQRTKDSEDHIKTLLFDDKKFLLDLMKQDNIQEQKQRKMSAFEKKMISVHKREIKTDDLENSVTPEKQPAQTNHFKNFIPKSIMKKPVISPNKKQEEKQTSIKKTNFENMEKPEKRFMGTCATTKGVKENVPFEKIKDIMNRNKNKLGSIIMGDYNQNGSTEKYKLSRKEKRKLKLKVKGAEGEGLRASQTGRRHSKENRGSKENVTDSNQTSSGPSTERTEESSDDELQHKLERVINRIKMKWEKRKFDEDTTETEEEVVEAEEVTKEAEEAEDSKEIEEATDVFDVGDALTNKMNTNLLKNKLEMFNHLIKSIEPARSYNIDKSHPLYNLLCRDDNSFLSSNWHDRLNFAFRKIWNLEKYIHEETSITEKEKGLFSEIESFHMSSKIGACGLIYSLFLKEEAKNIKVEHFKKCFVRLTQHNFPHIYKIYKPKFDDDLVFLFDSIVFTVVLGSEKDNVNCNTARKIYSNDIKGKYVLCECVFKLAQESVFSIPIANQIDFMGVRVIAEPLMPLGLNAVPIDVIKESFANMIISDQEETAWNEAYTKNDNEKNNCSVESNDTDDADEEEEEETQEKGTKSVKGEAEKMQSIFGEATKGVENGKKRGDKSRDNEKRRKQKKKRKMKKWITKQQIKRKKDLFYERIIAELENFDAEFCSQLRKMGNELNLKSCILPFGVSNYFICNILKRRNTIKVYKSLIDNLYVIRGTEEVLPPFLSSIKKENYLTRLRYEFIKYFRVHKVPLSNTTLAIDIQSNNTEKPKSNLEDLNEASAESLNNLNTYVIPHIVNLTTSFNDSYDITYLYHIHGINMCNLGYLLKNEKCPNFFKHLLCREIVCRTLKCVFIEHVHVFLQKILKKEMKKNDVTEKKAETTDWSTEQSDLFNKYFSASKLCKKKESVSSICYCDKCFVYWSYFPELVPHEFLIRLTNLTLNVTTYTSLNFWDDVLLPYCLKKYDLDIKEYMNIAEVHVYSFLLSIEYHFGVFFKKECKRNGKVKLPLTLDDLSDFSSKSEKLLFPNITKLKSIFSIRTNPEYKKMGKSEKKLVILPKVSPDEITVFEKEKRNKNDTHGGNTLINGTMMPTVVSGRSTKKNYVNIPEDNNTEGEKMFLKRLKNTTIVNDKQKEIIDNMQKQEVALEEKRRNKTKEEHHTRFSLPNKKPFEYGRTNKRRNSKPRHEIDNDRSISHVMNDNNMGDRNYGGDQRRMSSNSLRTNEKMDPWVTLDDSERSDKEFHQKTSLLLFYPKSNICAPRYSTCTYRKIENCFSKIITQEKFKIKTISEDNIPNITEIKKNVFLNRNVICTVGMCSQIRSSIYEYNIPCNPYCEFNEKMKCINYDKAKKSILLLLSININKNIFEICKIFLFLAYLHFEHGYIEKCTQICYHIYTIIPELDILKREFLILLFQCKLKEEKLEDAVVLYKIIKDVSYCLEGEHSVNNLLCSLILANIYNHLAGYISGFKKKEEDEEEVSANVNNNYDRSRIKMASHNIDDSGMKDVILTASLSPFESIRSNRKLIQKREDMKRRNQKEKGNDINKRQYHLDDIDHLELKNKYIRISLHYSKECFKTISNIFNDLNSHWIYPAVLILYGNCLIALRQFSKAVAIINLSLNYSEKGKLPPFIILQNKCLLVDALKNNGNMEQACEIAEECLNSAEHFVSVSHNLTLYILFRLAQMKQQIGCKNIMNPNILINSGVHNPLKRAINADDFFKLEQHYLDAISQKYIKESVDLYVTLFYRLRKKRNYEIVFAKDFQGNLYTQKDLKQLEKEIKRKKRNSFSALHTYGINTNINSKAQVEDDGEKEGKDEREEEEEAKEAEEDLERIIVVIYEILKIRVITMDLNTQKLFGAKLLSIVLSKNASAFVKEQTLKSEGFYRNLLFKHLRKLTGRYEERNVHNNKKTLENENEDDEDEDNSEDIDMDTEESDAVTTPEKYMYKMINTNERTEQIINNIYRKQGAVNYINEVENDNYFFEKKNKDRTLNLQLSDFYMNKQKRFIDLSHPTKEYDLAAIEKILYDDMYFKIEDICKYCYLRCVKKCKRNKKRLYNGNDYFDSIGNIGMMNESVQNPTEWFDLLISKVNYGKNDNLELIILIDLVKRFLTPLQKQLILYHVKLMLRFKDTTTMSEYVTHLLENQKKNILYIADIIDHKKKEFAGENILSELSQIYKNDVESNADFLAGLIVTNPQYFNSFPSELKYPYKNVRIMFNKKVNSKSKDAALRFIEL